MEKSRINVYKLDLKRCRCLLIMIMIMVALSFSFSAITSYAVSTYNSITIVLDAGHGGRDGGSVGVSGAIEKDLNLAYTLALKEKLEAAGYRVVLTRKNDDGLYSPLATNKKASDMKARFEIIKRANPNLIISIHMNSFNDKSAKGATTYHRSDDEASKTCGDLIQNCLNTYVDARFEQSKAGDYYILNCNYYAAVLIECGFLSNPEEEALLQTKEYRNKIVYAIFSGILLYFGSASLIGGTAQS